MRVIIEYYMSYSTMLIMQLYIFFLMTLWTNVLYFHKLSQVHTSNNERKKKIKRNRVHFPFFLNSCFYSNGEKILT